MFNSDNFEDEKQNEPQSKQINKIKDDDDDEDNKLNENLQISSIINYGDNDSSVSSSVNKIVENVPNRSLKKLNNKII